MKKLLSFSISTLLLCSLVACTETSVNNNHQQATLEVVEAGEVVLETIDTLQGGRYNVVANDNTTIVEKTTYPSYSGIDYWGSFEFSDRQIVTYQYNGTTLEKLPEIDQYKLNEEFAIPFYLNSSNEICYLTGDGLQIVDTFTSSIETSRTLDLGRMILKGSSLPWVLFVRDDVQLNNYTLYNLENHNHYSFPPNYRKAYYSILDGNIRQFYKFGDTVMLGIDYCEEYPCFFHYDTYRMVKELTLLFNDNLRPDFIAKNEEDSSKLGMQFISHLSLIPKEVQIENDIENTFLDGNRITEVIESSENISIQCCNNDTSQLVWMSTQKNALYLSDMNTGDIQETLLNDEIISQTIPFKTDTSQGLWIIPSLTTIGAANHVYLLTWQNEKPVLSKHNIGNYYFNESAFVNEEGALCIIATDLTAGEVQYNLLLVEPENTHQLLKYSVVLQESFLQEETGTVQFKKVPSVPGQCIISASANTHYQPDETLEGLYRLVFSE